MNTAVFAKEEIPLYDDFAPAEISLFACSLIKKGEYYRAYVELLRLNSFYPSFIQPSVFDITVNYLFYKSKKFDNLLESDFTKADGNIFIPLSLFKVDSLIKQDRIKSAETELLTLYERADATNYYDYLNKRSVYLSIRTNNKNLINKDKFYKFDELILYSDSIAAKRKNPVFGAVAGLFPGMGFFYAGEKGTGFVSMIVVGAGSALAYASYKEGWDSMALVSGAITFFFYGGSIAGGYMQSLRYNESLMKTLEMRLDSELMPERDLEEIYIKFGLSANDCK